MLKRILIIGCLSLMAGSAFAAPAVDYTDVWFNRNESGWGVNLVQTENFIFMTFYLYGPTSQPTWVTAQVTRDSAGNFTGPLFATNGSWYGGVFNPVATSVRQAGTATFRPTSSFDGSLSYTIDGVVVTKSIERLTLTVFDIGGTYRGVYDGSLAQCTNPISNSTFVNAAEFRVFQTETSLRIDTYLAGTFNCRLEGPFTQRGKLYQMQNASYTCAATGLNTTANVVDIAKTMQGFEGSWNATTVTNCRETARFAAVYQFTP